MILPRGINLQTPEFKTHLNYLKYMCNSSNEITLTCSKNIVDRFSNKINLKELKKKEKMVSLLRKNLIEEQKAVITTPEYAQIAVIWLPVKAYYLIFNILMILEFLINGDEKSFHVSHTRLLKTFVKSIQQKELMFSKDVFNDVCSCEIAKKIKIPSGTNLKENPNLEDLKNLLLKKLYQYKLEDYKNSKGIKNVRKKKDKEDIVKFEKGSLLNLFEFFYWYRIKANYRDVEFMTGITTEEYLEYYKYYYCLTINFHNAILGLLKKLYKTRFGNELSF